MNEDIGAFVQRSVEALTRDYGPAGREVVRQLLEVALRDERFIAGCLGPDNQSKKTLVYQDPKLGFCIYAHVLKSQDVGKPHDHGSSWAIYGQAAGVTEMTEWRRSGGKTPAGIELVEPARRYRLEAGTAVLYNEGVVHSTKRDAETRLIRITGCDLDKDNVPRDRYQEVVQTAA
jgi:predicted metal-dependent enzyme (double-stranded beta helix superfamily)